MDPKQIIFENIMALRSYAETLGNAGLVAKVQAVENTALVEICEVDLSIGGDDYAAVMAEVFPAKDRIRGKIHNLEGHAKAAQRAVGSAGKTAVR